ncbi:transketolase [Nigerium massiliense]|uniref:transketolase n=1 Tax=Nigerium massiliense TaxID=1522317 RepID=UPI00058EFEB9|nr:transketolase [Nigerium massiliense]
MTDLTWNDLDRKAVDTARVLAADAVQKVGNGHPGTAISLAPIAYLLYQKVMNVDPSDDLWLGRDRFVLSAGHSSLTQYNQLFLAGFGLEVDDIASLRTWGSLTPGHPEVHHTKGVECTTGPLGAGVSNAVGFAMAARRERELYDPNSAPGESVFDHFVYAIAGDGCMQEGVASEASSLAATQDLGNLILIYDDNRISIEGDTKISFSEDVEARYAAYGWHTQHVDFTNGFTEYEEKVQELYDAIEAAKKVTDKPSFIKVTTVIGWPLPTKAGDHSVHGSALGDEEVAALKKELGFDPEKFFDVDPEVLDHTRANAAERAAKAHEEWDAKFEAWKKANPEQAKLLDRVLAKELPAELDGALPTFTDEKMSTRKASGKVLTAIGAALPELWGGSADLASSNNTTIEGSGSFLPSERGSHDWEARKDGRTLHFGIREHAMGGILNGINLSGLTRAYGGTFLVFSDYMRPSVRLASIGKTPTVFVWTHDSIGVGEDGPTHQPIEHVASLRLIPGLDVVRPADANETAAAWKQILSHTDRPAGLILSRQDLLNVDRSGGEYASTDGVAKGGYTLIDASEGAPKVVLVATGSEVEIALAAREQLEGKGVPARVVSMPCVEWFKEQDDAYKAEVLPDDVPRVSIEAGVTDGWRDVLGCNSASLGLDHFGASASGKVLYKEFGITAEAAVELADSLLK